MALNQPPLEKVHGVFWRRLAAFLIDWVILGIALYLSLMAITKAAEATFSYGEQLDNLQMLAGLLAVVGIPWLYFSLYESSENQATIGKAAMGVVVTNLEGGRIGFGRATLRFFGRIVSLAILAVGYLLALFTRERQALHDLIAGTRVVRKPPR